MTSSAEYPFTLRVVNAQDPRPFFDPRYEELRAKHPLFPREVDTLLVASFLGQEPEALVVGSSEVATSKMRVLAEWVDLQALKDSFFFQRAMKVPRFKVLDWEIVVKQAERGVAGVPSLPYALMSLTTRDAKGTTDLCFAANERLLREFIETAEQALKALREVMAQRAPGGPDVVTRRD